MYPASRSHLRTGCRVGSDRASRWMAQACDRMRGALGTRAVRIEHIGSTSIPGLAAKPIIDIMLVVADCTDEEGYVADLGLAGFVLQIREPAGNDQSIFHGVEPHRVFKRSEIDLNLHVWSFGSLEVHRHRSFRDWLRTHPDDLELYERTTFELAARSCDNVQQYADAKTAVIEEIPARSVRSEQNDATIG